MKTRFTRMTSVLLAVLFLFAMFPLQAIALENGGAGGSEAGELQWICMSGTHSWNDGVVTTAATCTGTGVRTFTCTICGTTKTENIAALGHAYGEWTVTTEPTCGNPGEKTRVCANDPTHVEVEVINATGVHVPGDLVPGTAATCTEAGTLDHYVCQQCGANIDAEGNLLGNITVSATGHTWVEWQEGDDIATFTLKTEATTESAAVYYKKCSVDGTSAQGIDETQTFTYGEPLPEAAFVYGDADGDNSVTFDDLILLSKLFAEIVTVEDMSAGADADGDGSVTFDDLILLSKLFAEIITIEDLGPED